MKRTCENNMRWRTLTKLQRFLFYSVGKNSDFKLELNFPKLIHLFEWLKWKFCQMVNQNSGMLIPHFFMERH